MMKKLLFLLIAMVFAMGSSWAQTLNESFEGTTFPPDDWTISTTAGSGNWQSSTSIAQSGTISAKSAYQSGGCTRWLITPKLSVTADATNFAFWIATDWWYSDGDDIEIFVSTTDNQTSSFSTTSLLSLTEDSVTTTWAQHSVDLSAYLGLEIYVAIRVTDNFGFNTFIDDVTGPNLFVPSCPKPSVLSYSNIGALSADISWTETGTASQWTVECKPTSETSWDNAISNTASYTTFSLTNLIGNTSYDVRVKAVCVSGTSESDWRIGSFTTPYSCPQPTSLAVPSSNITTTDALVSWNPTINPVNWDEGYLLQYKPSNVSDWNLATSVSAIQDTFYLIQGLNSSTGYTIRLKAVCNPGVDSSAWTSTVNFSTLCVPINAFPWAEGFEGLASANTLPNNCWTATNIGTYTGTQNSNYNSYNRNARTGTGAAWYRYGCNDSFKTPSFQFAANTSYDFSFWYVTDGLTGWNTLRAELWDATTNTLVDTLGSQINNPINTTYSFYTSSFIVPNDNDSYYVSILCQSTSNPYYLTIDDVSVDFSPTCPSTYNLTSTLRSSTSVDLNWLQNGNGSGWVIAYGDTTGFDPSIATQTITISSTDPIPYTLTGLTPQTPYSYAVRQACNGGAWSNITSLTTPANAAILPYSHSFEDGSENGSWTLINGTQTNQWVIGTAADTLGATGLYVSNDQGVTNAYSVGTSRVYAYRDFEVPAGAGELELSFDWRAQGGSAYSDFLRIYLVPLDANITAGVIPPNGLDASAQIGNYTGGTGEHWLNQSMIWQHKTMRINSTQFPNLAGRTWRLLVHWRNESTTTTGIQPPASVDNINLSVVACSSPSALAASNITTTSALLTWTENGSATDWIIEYKPSSTTTWTTYQTTSNPDSITNLMPGTSYTARLRSLCSDTSLYSNSITFQTLCVSQTVPTPAEGFLTAVPPTTCWSRMQGTLPATGNATLTSTTGGWIWNSNVTPHNTKVNIYSVCSYWLISPSVDLGDGTVPAQIEFDAFYTLYGNTNAAGTTGTDDRFAVVVSTDDGLTWNAANATIWSNATGATRVLNNIPNTPTHIILPLFDPATTLPYTGNIKIGFYGESTASNADNDLHIDNFEVLPYSTCQRPTSVIASSITSTDATVNFTENGSSTSWEYVYGDVATITDPSTVTAIATTTNPILLSGLTPQTQYNIWVRSICDNGNSDWSNLYSFVTEALPATLPYACDFETSTENLAWKSLSNGINIWAIGTAAANGSTSTGTQANYISNDNGASYAMTYGNIYAYTSRDIDFGTDPASFNLSFDWKCQGYAWSTSVYAGLRVYLRDPSEAISTSGLPINPDDNLGTYYNSSTWQNAQLPIDNVSGVKRLIFVYFDGWYNYAPPAAIDNISLVQATCPRPASVVASNLTPTTAEISWVHPGADSYIVSYRTNTSAMIYEAATTSPYTIQGLTPGTQYLVSVRAICVGDTTISSLTIAFQVPCESITTFPWTESFESIAVEDEMPTCMAWTGTTNTVKTYLTSTDHNRSARTGNKYLSYSWSCDNYVYTPVFALQAGTSYDFSFWYKADGATGYGPLEASLMSSQSSTSVLSPIGTPIPADIQNTTYTQYQGTFTPDADGNYYIGIHVVGTSNPWYLTIDDLSLDLSSGTPCPVPTAVAVTNITTTTADVAWTAGGTETLWEVRLGTTGTPVSVTTPTYPLTGLTQGTNYTVYVRANCGTEYSAWVASTQFTTTSGGYQLPTVITEQETGTTQTSTTLNGSYIQGTNSVLVKGFQWKELSLSAWTTLPISAGTTPFAYLLNGLSANTQYEFRAYVETSLDTTYGATLQFITLANVLPNVTTDSIANISQTSATFYGTITQGTEQIGAKGFEYKLSSEAWEDAINISAIGVNNITANPTTLTQGREYNVRAYGRTLSDTTYGQILTFNTWGMPSVTTEEIVESEIQDHSATLKGTVVSDGFVPASQVVTGFVYSTTSNPIIGNTGVLQAEAIYNSESPNFTKQITNLESNSTYYFKAYIINPVQTSYGNEVSFTTLSINGVDGKEISVMMYPNPANNETKLIVSGVSGETKIVLSDVQGRILSTFNTKAVNGVAEQTIDVNNLAKGVYYVRIQNSNLSRTNKLIVK